MPEKPPIPPPGREIFGPMSRAKARSALNKAGGHLSYADKALNTAWEELRKLGLEDEAEEIHSIRDRIYGINDEISDVVRRIR